MALKAYTLDLALQTSSEFAIGNTIPNLAGIATDSKGFIPTKNSINKTITLSKGFGKFGGRLFEMTEQTVYSWDTGSADADAYLVIDFTKQNSFKGTIEDGTYEFIDNQSSIVLSNTAPSPSANVLVYKLDGNYGDDTINGDKIFTGKITATQPINGAFKTRASTFTDFADVAKNMFQYAGNWFVNGNVISNKPNVSNYLVVTITPANFSGSGKIEVFEFTSGKHYEANVSSSTLGNWKLLSDDSTVVHKTDKETIAGDKTFTGKIKGVTKTGSISSSGYRPAMNYAYNDFMVQVTLAGGNPMVPVGQNFTLPNEIPAPAMSMTLNLGSGILLNVQADRNINVSGGNLPGNFFHTLTWVPA